MSSQIKTDYDQYSNPLKLLPLSPQIPIQNIYQKHSTISNKPFITHPLLQPNKTKLEEISFDKRVPPIAYRPSPSQFMHVPVMKPVLLPNFVQKEGPSANEGPQANIGLSSSPKITQNGIIEPTSQPIVIKKEVSISLPHIKQQQLIESSPVPVTQFIKTPDKKTVNKPITIEKEVSISAPKGQLAKTPDQETIQQTTGQTMVSVNVPYEQQQSIINLPPIYQITETFDGESTSQKIPVEKEVSISAPYYEQPAQPIVNLSPQLQQIKLQKEISIPLPYQKKNIGLSEPLKPKILPSPPPLLKTSTSGYIN